MSLVAKSTGLCSISAAKAGLCSLFFQWDNLVKGHVPFIPRDVISTRLFSFHQRETHKLIRRVSQNMYDELEKHREGHRVLEKQRFIKESSVFFKSIPQPSQM